MNPKAHKENNYKLTTTLIILFVIPLPASQCNGQPPNPTNYQPKLSLTGTGTGKATVVTLQA